MSSYEVRASDVRFTGHIGRVRVDQVRFPDGDAAREVVEHVPAVAIVAIDAQDCVILVRQYRHPVRRITTEIPAGLCDVDGEDPVQTAQRELAEEVGLAAGRIEAIGAFENSVGWTDERTLLYVATELTDRPAPDGFLAAGEEALMEVERRPFAQVHQQVLRGEVTDSKTVIGVLLVAARR